MRRIVIIEDEELVRRGIVQTVDWASVDCTVVGQAANGLSGLALVRETRPDLIVTDIRMPVMDGIDMVKALREEGNRVCVIFLTAYSDFSFAQSAVKLGAADYLLKPFHDGELEQAVRRVLDHQDPSAPELPSGGKQNRYVAQAVRYMEVHYAEDITLASLSAHLGLSESHLSHLFKDETGQSPGNYLLQIRLREAMEMLKDCRNRVSEVAERTGFRDIAYFSSTFKKNVGMSPSEYQKSAGTGG